MTINLRDLYPRLGQLRSDIDSARFGWALEEATIKLASDSNLLRNVLTGITLPLGAVSAALTLPADRTLGRVEKVEYQDPDDTDHQWVQLDETAAVYMDAGKIAAETKTVNAVPSIWALRASTLYFQNPSDKAYPLRVTYAWVPKRNVTDLTVPLDLPSEAEDAILSIAEYLIWRETGPGQNIQLSELAKKNYNQEHLPECRAIADTGPSGCRSIFDFLPAE